MSQLHPSSLARGQRSPEDITCIHCGYLLRGLNARGTCPECGTPIFKSLRGDGLEFADDRWLTHLRRGTSLLFWYAICSLIHGVAWAIVIATSAGNPGAAHFGTGKTIIACAIALDLTLALAAWLVTTPEPRAAADESPFSFLQLLRYAAATVALGRMAEVAALYGSSIPAVYLIVVLGAESVRLAVYLGLGVIYRRLALRMQDYDLAAQFRFAAIAFAIAYGVLVLNYVAEILLATFGIIADVPANICISFVAMIVMWGFTIWIIRLLRQYEYALLHAERKASRPAEVPPPPPPAPEE